MVLFTHGLYQTEHRLYTRCGRLRFNVQASWLNFCVLTRSSSGWCVGRFRVTSPCERESSPHLAPSIYTFKSLPVHLKDHRALSRSEVTEQESVDGRRRIRRLCVCVHTHTESTHTLKIKTYVIRGVFNGSSESVCVCVCVFRAPATDHEVNGCCYQNCVYTQTT